MQQKLRAKARVHFASVLHDASGVLRAFFAASPRSGTVDVQGGIKAFRWSSPPGLVAKALPPDTPPARLLPLHSAHTETRPEQDAVDDTINHHGLV